MNVNQWLIANGLAVPAFYASMSPGEITTLTALYDIASTPGVPDALAATVPAFDFALNLPRGRPTR